MSAGSTASSLFTFNVNYVLPALHPHRERWKLIHDCVEGSHAIKKGREHYLPMPNSEDHSTENVARYESYLKRAVYYNATGRTLAGLVGQVFDRDPYCSLPKDLDALTVDIDGSGNTLLQQSKGALELILKYGRAGLLADFPSTVEVATKAEVEGGFVRPTITLYDPMNIINWRTMTVGARKLLSLVVVEENYIKQDDGFMVVWDKQWRVLRLDEETMTVIVELWRMDTPNGPAFTFQPKDASGAPLKEIPFTFIGSKNNDAEIDPSPLYDLAILNIAHYRNSADYEESCFLVGQPTPYFTGLTKSWVDEVMKGTVSLGSRAAIPLPVGGSAGLLQAEANGMVKEAMEQKERQMVALGARLVEQKAVQRTLGEASLEEASETSVLSMAANNVSEAYERALGWAAMFVGATGECEYDLNAEFPTTQMNPQMRAQLMAEWQAGALTYTEYRNQLRMAGAATLSDEDAKDELDMNPPPALAMAQAAAKDPVGINGKGGQES